MKTYRTTAIVVGVLFFLATVLNVMGNSFLKPILDASDYLYTISANENQVIMAALLVLLSAFACAGIAIGLYPILKKHHAALALASVSFRVMEGLLYILGVVCLLSLLTLSQEYIKAAASNASLFQVSGTLLLAVKKWAGELGVIAFTLGGLLYYYVFFQSKLVPRFISVWGFFGAALTLLTALLTIYGQLLPLSNVFILLNLPIALQEFVLALWLIIKGFNQSAVASGSGVIPAQARI